MTEPVTTFIIIEGSTRTFHSREEADGHLAKMEDSTGLKVFEVLKYDIDDTIKEKQRAQLEQAYIQGKNYERQRLRVHLGLEDRP